MTSVIEKRTDMEEGVPFGIAVQSVISNKPEVLWGIVKESEVDFPKFAFKVGKRILEAGSPEILLKFLGRNELKDKDLTKKLENEARSRIESREGGKV
jgi:hypothetical protein